MGVPGRTRVLRESPPAAPAGLIRADGESRERSPLSTGWGQPGRPVDERWTAAGTPRDGPGRARAPQCGARTCPQTCPRDRPLPTLHLHLLSDSTGETLDGLAKAALAQFEDVAVERHFWPMIRSSVQLERVLADVTANPGLVLFTIANVDTRATLERRLGVAGVPAVSVLDPVIDQLSSLLGREATGRSGRQHSLDAAYFDRVEAIQFTIAHDDGLAAENWEAADIVLAGVSRTSKTPTAIYLANRGYRVANIPVVPESPPPAQLWSLEHPLVVGLTTSPDRLIQIRRNRLLSLNETATTDYVDPAVVSREVAYARRLFADADVPVIDVTRRSIEETAAAVIALLGQRRRAAAGLAEATDG